MRRSHRRDVGTMFATRNKCLTSSNNNSNSFVVTTSKALVTTSVALVTTIAGGRPQKGGSS